MKSSIAQLEKDIKEQESMNASQSQVGNFFEINKNETFLSKNFYRNTKLYYWT